ncbi:MAG: lysoplasmalogenase [Verrucomicrobia subdivision 3 bacterium]|nr:lysoplasmalogenase [Limisphaerales bacterium]
MRWLAFLLVPALFAGLALSTGALPFKLGVPGLCALLLLGMLPRSPEGRRRELWSVIAAFGMSMVGDYFLSSRRGHVHYFEVGIAAFFVAHLGYLRYSLLNGRLHRLALVVLTVVFLPYFALALAPAIHGGALWVAVLLYLLISCIGLAAAVGLKSPAGAKGFYVAGIGLVVASDTIISFNEFLHWRALNGWILPTYYLAQLAITTSILLRSDRRPDSRTSPESRSVSQSPG